jgi:penicillin amidase
VINGRLTDHGQALLANDTHLIFTVPSLYYLMHLHSPAVNVVGAAFPGLPGLVVGRNEYIAWGITNGMVDDIDLVRLQPDSSDADYYRFGRQRYRYIYHDETIAIRGGGEKKVRITWSHLGPVVSAETPILGYRGEHPLVLRWSGFENDDPLTSFQQLLNAQDWGDFLAALESSKNPGENFFYADRAGQIGYKLAAAVPRRTYVDAIVPAAATGWAISLTVSCRSFFNPRPAGSPTRITAWSIPPMPTSSRPTGSPITAITASKRRWTPCRAGMSPPAGPCRGISIPAMRLLSYPC